MIRVGTIICPSCGRGKLTYVDKVDRFIIFKNRKKRRIKLRRFRCCYCGAIHRELPKIVLPYKQYGASVIFGVLNKTITPENLDYEDYPTELTMTRWLTEFDFTDDDICGTISSIKKKGKSNK